MRKKLLATVLAASMVLSLAPILPVNTENVANAEDAAEKEEIAGIAWWDAGNKDSKHYNLKGDGTLTLYVGCVKAINGATSFCVELNKDTKYITSASNWDIWGVEGATFEGKDASLSGKPVEGHQYKITVTRTGNDFTIVYFDLTDNKEFHSFAAKGADMGADVDVYVKAQEGTLWVSSSEMEMPAVTPSTPSPTPDSGTSTPGASSGSNLDAITTQPVAKYTFDSADGIELAGEAKVADGVLNLATAASNGKTYAKIADLSSNDFTNGITLTADIKVAGYSSDWTPIFMLGDGTLGGEKNGATITYHLTQGFSSREDISAVGYFGSDANAPLAAPYTWDYFSNEANRNQWLTLTVTIASDKMTTYINGAEVQSMASDFSKLLASFKSAKNNYLGSSYWPADPDFIGSMDNVAIYNSALSADDVKAIATTASDNPSTPTPTPTPDIPDTPTPTPDVPDTPTPTPDVPDTPDEPETPAKKTMKLSKVSVKKNATKITGTVSVKKATVKVKVGKKAYKKATVKNKNFTLKVAKLKKGTKVTIKVTKSGYKTLTKSYNVK